MWKQLDTTASIAVARYAHTNLIAHDWRRLSAFYVEAFGCVPLAPERDLRGDWFERGTASRAHIFAACTCACRDMARTGRLSSYSVMTT
jgi:hypothetical protein